MIPSADSLRLTMNWPIADPGPDLAHWVAATPDADTPPWLRDVLGWPRRVFLGSERNIGPASLATAEKRAARKMGDFGLRLTDRLALGMRTLQREADTGKRKR